MLQHPLSPSIQTSVIFWKPLHIMNVLSVNVGLPRTVEYNGEMISTSIFKEPVQGRVQLGTLHFDGDGQADLKNHGGTYKAVYAYPHANYAIWSQEIGRNDLTYGQFGENLTVTELTEETVHIGDIFRMGDALLEVTQPRIPCFKLGIRMNDPGFVKRFLESNRSGFYLRVLETGTVGAGDPIERVKIGEEQMAVSVINNLRFFDKTNTSAIQRAITIPALAPGWRQAFEAMLAGNEAN